MSGHTELPWCIPAGKQNGFIICAGDDPAKPGPILMIVTAPRGRSRVLTVAAINDNTAFMVKAVNSHPELVKALEEMQEAETAYRMCHDLDGDGHINTGRAWDKLRQAGQRARQALAKVQPT